jgi:hypothetical protein
MPSKEEILRLLKPQIDFFQGNPPISVIADKLHVTEDKARAILRQLKLIKGVNFVPSEEEQKKINRNRFIRSLPVMAVRILMGFIGIGASAMSCFYTMIWLKEFLPDFLAFFLSFLMVIFAVLSFQTVLLIHKNYNRARLFLIPIFSFLWLVVTIFSMGSTIAGQYNARYQETVQTIAANDSLASNKIQLQLAVEEISSIELEIAARQRDRDSMLSTLEKITEMSIEDQQENAKLYNDTWARMNAINGRLNQLNNDLQTARSQYRNLVQQNASVLTITETQNVRNFYTWISGVLHVNQDQIQFWSSIFPAIFIDIIAPLGIAVALFLHIQKQRRKK